MPHDPNRRTHPACVKPDSQPEPEHVLANAPLLASPMPSRQLSRSTLILVILLTLLCTGGWKLWDTWSIQRHQQQTILDQMLAARAATASNTQHALTYSRPWVKLESESLFDFTDNEWQTLTNTFADKLSALVPEQLVFAEGAVTRVTSARLKELSTSENVQTNAVWFLK